MCVGRALKYSHPLLLLDLTPLAHVRTSMYQCAQLALTSMRARKHSAPSCRAASCCKFVRVRVRTCTGGPCCTLSHVGACDAFVAPQSACGTPMMPAVCWVLGIHSKQQRTTLTASRHFPMQTPECSSLVQPGLAWSRRVQMDAVPCALNYQEHVLFSFLSA